MGNLEGKNHWSAYLVKDTSRRQFLISLGIWGVKHGSMGYKSHTECHPGFCLGHLFPSWYYGFSRKLTFGALSTSISFIQLPETAFACQVLIALSEDNCSSFTALSALWVTPPHIQLSAQFLTWVSFQSVPQPGISHKYLQLLPCLGGLFKNALLRSLTFISSTRLRFLSWDSQLTSFAQGSWTL